MEETLDWLWFSQLFPYGSDLPRELLAHFESPRAVQEAPDSELRALGFLNEAEIRMLHSATRKRAEFIWNACQENGIQILTFYSKQFPQRLKNIYGPPMVLYVKGMLGAIDRELALGVVGTRTASEYGVSVTLRLCEEIARAGVTIVSGCAVGIDAAAHQAAVNQNVRTIAVLGCGLDVDYPRENRELKQQILAGGGALIGEVPPGVSATPQIFPVRNRIISALSLGVLVTEAPGRSGSLITANHAAEQGKDVFCVPPQDIFSGKFSGTAKLIRDGACCVFSAQDILQAFLTDYPYKLEFDRINSQYRAAAPAALPQHAKPMDTADKEYGTEREEAPKTAQQTPPKLHLVWDSTFSAAHKKVFDLLTETPQMADDLVLQSDLPLRALLPILTELEIEGFLTALPGRMYARTDAEVEFR